LGRAASSALYGSERPLPDNIDAFITEADIQRERRYLFPTHMRLKPPVPVIRKGSYKDLPASHPGTPAVCHVSPGD